MKAIFRLILIAICQYFGSITVYAETDGETRLSNYLKELLLNKAPSIKVSKITHVVNRHYAVKPKTTIETDTLSNDYYLRINNNNAIHSLCLDYGDSLYLLEIRNFNSLFSALSRANGEKMNNSIEFFIDESIRSSNDSIIEVNNNIYYFEDSIFIKGSHNKRMIYDLTSNLDCKQDTLPINEINNILNVNCDKDYSIAENISKMKLNIRPELDSIFQIYKVELPYKINKNNMDKCFILIISYKRNFFVCPSWDYNTWACILFYIKCFDRNKCNNVKFNTDDFLSIVKSIDTIYGNQWVEFKQLKISPSLYKTLIMYSEQ